DDNVLNSAQSSECSSSYQAQLDYIEIAIANSGQKQLDREKLFGKQHGDMFILDGNLESNVGRMLNHSCSPNLCTQNVFIETHGARFNHMAFFASRNIFPFEELTFDYGYEMGSDAKQVLYCNCGSLKCKLRIL